jgi:hypothetical protein
MEKQNELLELQRQNLFVNLKILKELRYLNKTLKNKNITDEYFNTLSQTELEDVKEAISKTGYNFV